MLDYGIYTGNLAVREIQKFSRDKQTQSRYLGDYVPEPWRSGPPWTEAKTAAVVGRGFGPWQFVVGVLPRIVQGGETPSTYPGVLLQCSPTRVETDTCSETTD